jgi:hypothetical protein
MDGERERDGHRLPRPGEKERRQCPADLDSMPSAPGRRWASMPRQCRELAAGASLSRQGETKVGFDALAVDALARGDGAPSLPLSEAHGRTRLIRRLASPWPA